MVSLEKWIPEKPISAIYFNGAKDRYFIKRFTAGSQNTDQKFIPDGSKVQLEMISTEWKPVIEITFSKSGKNIRDNEIKHIEEIMSVKGIKAIGNQELIKGSFIKIMIIITTNAIPEYFRRVIQNKLFAKFQISSFSIVRLVLYP